MKIKTKDLWQSAFMLAMGVHLADVSMNPGGRKREVYFTLDGAEADALSLEFKTGQALCRVTALRGSMAHLKEEIHKTIKI